jgi:hypothetical protein
VDLPGLRDLNSARQNITERYARQCDGIFVVCAIIRAASDASVPIVFDLARKARLTNVGIICTRSEVSASKFPLDRRGVKLTSLEKDIRADEAVRDWDRARKAIILRQMDTIAAEERELASVRQELREDFGDDDPMNLEPDERNEYTVLSARQNRLRFGLLPVPIHKCWKCTHNGSLMAAAALV